MIDVKIWISDANDKKNGITPSDCTLYEKSFTSTAELSAFILERLRASALVDGRVEQLSLSIDGKQYVDAYSLNEELADTGIDEWDFTEELVQELLDNYSTFTVEHPAKE